MNQSKLSLIGTSQGDRINEIARLLESIAGYQALIELIFVDQSTDQKIEKFFSEYTDRINFKLIKSERCSLSKARNIALQYATGNIIGFCDDDAFYSEDIIRHLTNQPYKRTLLSVPVKDFVSNKNYANRNFPTYKKNLSYLGVIRYSLSVGTFIFLDSAGATESIYFDERLGAGTSLGGSEETDLFFRLKEDGYYFKFDPTVCVFHDNDPPSHRNILLAKKYEKYALGYAVVLKSHLLESKLLLLIEMNRVISRCLLGLFFPSKRLVCFYRLKGFLKGLLTIDLGKAG